MNLKLKQNYEDFLIQHNPFSVSPKLSKKLTFFIVNP